MYEFVVIVLNNETVRGRLAHRKLLDIFLILLCAMLSIALEIESSTTEIITE